MKDFKTRFLALILGILVLFSSIGIPIFVSADDNNTEDIINIEKYVNHDVHADIMSSDEIFHYTILARIPFDANEAVIRDDLVDTLRWASTADSVKVSTLGIQSGDHAPGGTVSESGDEINDAQINFDGQRMTIVIPDASPYQGHLIKIEVDAKLSGMSDEPFTIYYDDPVLTDGSVHEGYPNSAMMEVEVGNEWWSAESNTVTVRPLSTPTTWSPTLFKTLTGEILEEGQFSFTLSASADTPMPATTTVSNDANGHVIFPAITFDTHDIGNTYTYTVTENNTTSGYTKDTKTITYTVTVGTDGIGNVTAQEASNILKNTNNPDVMSLTGPFTWANGRWGVSSGGNGTGLVSTIDDSPIPGVTTVFSINNNTSGNRDWRQTNIPFESGETYVISGWSRGNANRLTRVWDTNQGKSVFTKTQTISGNKWQYFEYEYTFNGTEESCSLQIGLTGAGSIDLLDLRLETKSDHDARTMNNKAPGSLTVTKTVAESWVPSNKVFTFTVNFNNANGIADTTTEFPIVGVSGKTTIKGGQTFTLTKGQTATITEIPDGYTYTVTESADTAYRTTKTGDTGTITAGETSAAEFVNTPLTGGIRVRKRETGTTTPLTGAVYGLYDASGTLIASKPPVESGTYKGCIYFDGLAYGTYYIQEITPPEGYELSPERFTVVIDESVINANANHRVYIDAYDAPKRGSFEISKTVTGNGGVNNKNFTFNVTIRDADGALITESLPYYGDKTGTITNGQGTVQLKHGESVRVTGLREGWTYVVTEVEDAVYTTTASGDTGTIVGNILTGTGNITIGSPANPTTAKWRSASGGTGTRTVIDVSGLPNAGIKQGVELIGNGTATEIAQDGVPVANGTTYVMSCWAKGTGLLNLQYGRNPYPSKKITLNNVQEWTYYEYEFTVGAVSDGSSSGLTNIYFGNRGTGTMQIAGMQLVPLQEAKFTNTHKTVTLTGTKTVAGEMGNKNDIFNFRLTLTASADAALPSSISYTKTGANGTQSVNLTSGKYDFQLSHGEEIRFVDMPYGIKYSIIETSANTNGYSTMVSSTVSGAQILSSGASGVITANGVVSFINTRDAIVPTGIQPTKDFGVLLILVALSTICLISFLQRYRAV